MVTKSLRSEESYWLDRLAHGDQACFVAIYDRYWKDLLMIAFKVVKDKDVAKDLVQDVFTTFWENRYKSNEIHSLKSYLSSSVRHACIHYIERHINRYKFVDSLPDILESLLVESDVNEKIYLQEIEQCIMECVEKMPKKMRVVFDLSRNEGLTHKEIANNLSISPETVKKHVHNALVILRDRLKGLDSSSKALLLFYLLSK